MNNFSLLTWENIKDVTESVPGVICCQLIETDQSFNFGIIVRVKALIVNCMLPEGFAIQQTLRVALSNIIPVGYTLELTTQMAFKSVSSSSSVLDHVKLKPESRVTVVIDDLFGDIP